LPDKPKAQSLRVFTRLLLWLALLLPYVLCWLYVRAYGVNTPLSDDFTTVLVMKLFSVGQMNIFDILDAQHNEHRCGFPYVLTLLLAQISHYNCVHNMYMGVVFVGATLAVFLYFLWPKFKTAGITSFAFVPIAWLLCSLRQTQNLLMAFQGAYESAFFFVLCLFLLQGINGFGARFWFAALCALLSAFSFGNGLLAAPVGFLLLASRFLLGGPEQFCKHRQIIFSWALICLLIAGAYFWHYISGVGQGKVTLEFLMHAPLAVVAFAIGFLASPVAREERSAILIGTIYCLLCLVFAVSFARKPKAYSQDMILPTMLICFSVLSACMASLGRAQLGIDASYVSRYVTMANYGWIGLYLLALFAKDLGRNFRAIAIGTILICFTIGAVTTAKYCQIEALVYRDLELNAENVIRSYNLAGPHEIVRWIGLYAAEYGPLVQYLEQNRLSLFSVDQEQCHPAQQSQTNANPYWCVIDFANGRLNTDSKAISTIDVDLTSQTDIDLTGWVANLPQSKLPKAVWIVIDDHLTVPAAYGLTRVAVAASTKKDFLTTSGFASSLRANILAKGKHNVRLKILERENGACYLTPVMLWLNVR